LATTTPPSGSVRAPVDQAPPAADHATARPLPQDQPPPDLPPPSNRSFVPEAPVPPVRLLWGYARDPLSGVDMQFFDLHEVEIALPCGKDLKPGPVGEYPALVHL